MCVFSLYAYLAVTKMIPSFSQPSSSMSSRSDSGARIEVVDPDFKRWVVPITVAIIVGLFMAQRHGTAAVGRLFGPIMVAWFIAIGACGLAGITRHPEILKTLSPTYALTFVGSHFEIAFFALTAVVLAVTGAEALYADMGSFGRKTNTRAWLLLVLPALALSYTGQGALLLGDEKAISAPFILLIPGWALSTTMARAASWRSSACCEVGAGERAPHSAHVGHARSLRRRTVLRGQHDHSIDLGAVRHRGITRVT
jgi:KUP system potassium uptake protein